jgi:hypothetical protein
MSSDGKQLESLVAFVEEKLLPLGFTVKSNERVFNGDGIQVAEFDVEIRGKVGSTTIAWLIECRDRPGHGAAPGSWIEQLVGRKNLYGFNKVTAVSTTGFAPGASTSAKREGIELREVKSLDPSEFAGWLHISDVRQIKQVTDLKRATIFLSPTEPEKVIQAATAVIANATGYDEILHSPSSGLAANLTQAFLIAVQSVEAAFDGVTSGQPRKIQLVANYSDEDRYVIQTTLGSVEVAQIKFLGELRVEEINIPVIKTAEYRHAETGEPISQFAAFAPQSILEMDLALEMHRMAESGETYVIMRRLPDDV